MNGPPPRGSHGGRPTRGVENRLYEKKKDHPTAISRGGGRGGDTGRLGARRRRGSARHHACATGPVCSIFCFLATSACGQRGSPLLGAARCRQGRTPNGSQQQYAWRWPRPATPDACCHSLPSPALAPQARCCMPLAARRAASATMVVCLYSSSMCCVSALSPATISCCNHAGAFLRPPERPALIAGEVGMVGLKLQSQGKTTRHGTSHPSRHSAPIFQLLTPPDLHAPTLTPLRPQSPSGASN